MYLTGSIGRATAPYLDAHVIGYLATPACGNTLQPGWVWAADNGVFGSGWPGEAKWLAWLGSRTQEERERCLFATAPDVVGDAAATLDRSLPWLAVIRKLGYPAAFVAQDGIVEDATPWGALDVLFIGGSTEWKLGPEAQAIIAAAKERGKRVHAGRVNSQVRFLAFAAAGCDTADGTFLKFGPDTNLPKLLSWIRHHETQPALFKPTGQSW